MPYKDPDKQRAYQRKWYAARRAEWFAGKTCVDCGSDQGLELDHTDASLKVSHRIWSWSAIRREAELAKCVARCATCHNLKTTVMLEHSAKLTPEQAIEIRRIAIQGSMIQQEIADMFGVTQQTVSELKNGTKRTYLW